MKIIKISIAKAIVFNSVELNACYAGTKSEGCEFDKVATVEADEELLSGLWKRMCGELAERFKEYITATSVTDSEFIATFSLSGSYDEAMNDSVTEDLREAVVAGVTAGWFRFTNPAAVDEWKAESKKRFLSALSKICHRKRPVRPV